MTVMNTTAPLTSVHRTADLLEGFVTVNRLDDGTYTVSFEDAEVALKAVAKAKDAHVREYLRGGGNPRNKRAIGSQFAAVSKAIAKAI